MLVLRLKHGKLRRVGDGNGASPPVHLPTCSIRKETRFYAELVGVPHHSNSKHHINVTPARHGEGHAKKSASNDHQKSIPNQPHLLISGRNPGNATGFAIEQRFINAVRIPLNV